MPPVASTCFMKKINIRQNQMVLHRAVFPKKTLALTKRCDKSLLTTQCCGNGCASCSSMGGCSRRHGRCGCSKNPPRGALLRLHVSVRRLLLHHYHHVVRTHRAVQTFHVQTHRVQTHHVQTHHEARCRLSGHHFHARPRTPSHSTQSVHRCGFHCPCHLSCPDHSPME